MLYLPIRENLNVNWIVFVQLEKMSSRFTF